MAISTSRRIEDHLTNVSKALPAAAATATTDGIEIGNNAELLDTVEIEITVEATTTLAATKKITLGLETSADNGVADNYADVPNTAYTIVGAAGNGSTAFKAVLKPNSDMEKWIRATAAVEASGGDNTAKKFALKLKY